MIEAAADARQAETIHASCLVLGEAGILLRGPSGSGKSSVVRRAIADRSAAGRFARLVADDRTRLTAIGGRVVARPVPPLEGLLEVRGLGVLRVPYEPACRVRVVVDLSDEPPRLPDADVRFVSLLRIPLARLTVSRQEAPSLLTAWIDGVFSWQE